MEFDSRPLHKLHLNKIPLCIVYKNCLQFCNLFFLFHFQVRTKIDPLKWPILDSSGNPIFLDSSDISSHSQSEMIFSAKQPEFCPIARPLTTIPVPPVPKILTAFVPPVPVPRLSESESISSSMGESLNPDVPEFVPIVLAKVGETKYAKPETKEDEISNRVEPSNNESSDAEVNNKENSKDQKEIQRNEKKELYKEDSQKENLKKEKSEVLVNGEKESEDVWKEVLI